MAPRHRPPPSLSLTRQRVEIFYEWRAASQLLTLAQAGPAAVVPQQLPVVQPTATETVTETELEAVEQNEGQELVPIGQ
jgi:hypothetical protein